MWTEHPRGKNDQAIREVCDKFASVCVRVCVRAYVSDVPCIRLILCALVCVFVRARIIILTECAAFAVITNWYSYVAATITIRGAGSPTLSRILTLTYTYTCSYVYSRRETHTRSRAELNWQ